MNTFIPNQDRHPNTRKNGQLYLVRCYACDVEHGRENYIAAVSTGQCAWCGWKEELAPSLPQPKK